MTAFPADLDLPLLEVKARTVLLAEGQVAQQVYLVEQGCLRVWLSHDGRDLTLQFFVEGEGVSSIESFLTGRPSDFTIETVEPCRLRVMSKAEFERRLREVPGFRDGFNQTIVQRLFYYNQHLLSFIRDTPQQRYERLLQQRPDLVQRVPQHYLASFLGITRVSLSRIRARR